MIPLSKQKHLKKLFLLFIELESIHVPKKVIFCIQYTSFTELY